MVGLLLLLLPLSIGAYPYNPYNGHYNRFGDYILPGRPEYYSTSSYMSPYLSSFNSYSTPSVVIAAHGYGDYYRGFGNGLPTYGSTDGRFLSTGYRPYPLLPNDFSSFPMDRAFPPRFPLKRQ